ncbi:hypothetical protein MHA_0626 [Mannheimia haemolytica PHL213]|nr:hypothetical protein MHA_0626 [Mannheimia haemolytica PHL213]
MNQNLVGISRKNSLNMLENFLLVMLNCEITIHE